MPNEDNENMDTTDNFRNEIEMGYKLMRDAVKISCQFPVDEAREDTNLLYPNSVKSMTSLLNKTLLIASTILQHENIKGNLLRRDIDEKLNLITEANDIFLDRANGNMKVMNPSPLMPPSNKNKCSNATGSWNKDLTKSVIWKEKVIKITRPIRHLFEKHSIEKPQTFFSDKIDNSSVPFIPQLKEKPNSLIPLSIDELIALDGTRGYANPYNYEIDHFCVPEYQLVKTDPIPPQNFDVTPYLYVDDTTTLNTMIKHLEVQPEIAVDLEHHDYRSFQGFTCLMQISSRSEDFIIDTIKLRDKLYQLNQIFTDPKILKVFHGSEHDIIWLQRDFGIYVVNMFDTYQASVMLNFRRLSLMHLLNEYCHIDPDKRYQLYDWRIRPLSSEALTYARGDTHYLLYIYDVLRNILIDTANGDTNLLQAVYSQSSITCKKRYEKELLSEDSHLQIYKMSRRTFDNRQMLALKEIYHWRDKIARQEDDSINYVLPNHMLLQIADSLPREAQGILACCNPIPPFVKKHLLDIHQIVHKARNQPLVKDALEYQTVRTFVTQGPILYKMSCPHDVTHSADFRKNLPTLLDGTDIIEDFAGDGTIPKLNAFSEKDTDIIIDSEHALDENVKAILNRRILYSSPYQRYKKTILFIQNDKQIDGTEDQNNPDTLCNVVNVPINTEENAVSTKIKNNVSPKTVINDMSGEIKNEEACDKIENHKLSAKIKNDEVSAKTENDGLRAEIENDKVCAQNESNDDSTAVERDTYLVPGSKRKNKIVKEVPPSLKQQAKRFKLVGPSTSAPQSTKMRKQNSAFDYSKVDFNKFTTNSNSISKQLKKLNVQIRKNIMNKKAANRKRQQK